MPWNEKDEGQGGSIEYNFSIVSSKAGFTEYNDGNTCLLILEGEKEFDNGKLMDDNLWIAAPKGDSEGQWTWSATEDGSAFVPTDGDEERRFTKQSKIQQFINSALKAGVPLKERTENSLDARGWAGLKVRIREEEKSGTFGGESRSWRQPLVIEFLGEFDAPGAAASAGTTTAAGNASGNGDGDVIARAKAIAKETPDLIEYMDTVSKTLGVALDHQVCSAAFHDAARA